MRDNVDTFTRFRVSAAISWSPLDPDNPWVRNHRFARIALIECVCILTVLYAPFMSKLYRTDNKFGFTFADVNASIVERVYFYVHSFRWKASVLREWRQRGDFLLNYLWKNEKMEFEVLKSYFKNLWNGNIELHYKRKHATFFKNNLPQEQKLRKFLTTNFHNIDVSLE